MSGYGSTLTVRRQGRNSDGDPVGVGEDVTSSGWLFEPAGMTEATDGGRGTREAAVSRLRGYLRSDIAVAAGDRAYLAGDDRAGPPPWRVVGEPERWAGIGTVITLARTTG